MSPTGLQQFVAGEKRPQERTRRKVGEALIAEQEARRAAAGGGGTRRVAETRRGGYAAAVEQKLEAIFRDDPEQGVSELKRLFKRARSAPGEPPEFTRRLERALVDFVKQLPPPGSSEPPG